MSIEKMQYMQHALAAALRCGFVTAPNPRVGCVIVKDDKIIGAGFTQALGGNHAEIQALNEAGLKGHDLRGATAYVTLEPCSHFGRTPPADRHSCIAIYPTRRCQQIPAGFQFLQKLTRASSRRSHPLK